MIISKTPYRISFFGGGTDYPDYYKKYGGRTLSTSIDKYCYLALRRLPPFFEHKYRIVYSLNETVNAIEEIQHPSVRETLRYLEIDEGIEVTHFGDLPARTGLGSSSSFTVGMLNALYAYKGVYASKERLANEAIHVEQDLIKENVGSQDQTAAAYGGFNVVDYDAAGVHITPCILTTETRRKLEDSLIMVFTGISRTASDIAVEQIRTIDQKLAQLASMKELVGTALEILSGKRPDDFGRLLDETWRLKRSLTNRISSSRIDEMYDAAMRCGALGGKLIGAGGGGFLLFYVPEQARAAFHSRFEDCIRVPVRFESDGSRIIYCNSDDATQRR